MVSLSPYQYPMTSGIPRGRGKPPLSPQDERIGDALRERRIALQKRQEDVAFEADLSQKLISELERGTHALLSMSMGNVLNLARALKWELHEMQRAIGIDLGLAEARPMATLEPSPVYSLKALGASNPSADGVNITPNPGPHPKTWMQTFMDGDDMDPRIRDGESIYFDTDKTTPDKGVYVIRYRDRAYVRRYSQLPTGPAWTADNPAFAHQFIPDGPDVTVLGKVYRVVGIRDGKALN